jgi:integrase
VRAVDRPPFASPYKDRHGRQRWRYRRNGVTKALPGQPGDEAFEAAYSAALAGRPTQAEIVRHPNHAAPRTLKAAWRHYVQRDGEFKRLRQYSKDQYIARAERFLEMPVAPGTPLLYADVPVADLKRRHVKDLLGSMADRPHAASDLIVVLRKMISVALDLEWIVNDPTHKLRFAPEVEGHRAWEDWEREKFEARWPLGSTPRTIYALALYTGQRRADIVRIRWADFDGDTLALTQQKTGKRLRLPVLPYLRAALSAAPHQGDTVLATSAGNQRTPTGLTSNFHDWAEAAGLSGATIHGLRKTLGKILAEEGATTRELMDALGHDAIAHAELYSRAADQERMARTAFSKAEERLRPRLKVVGGEPIGEPAGDPTRKRLK